MTTNTKSKILIEYDADGNEIEARGTADFGE